MVICEIKNCTGCGLCAAVCPKKCITLKKNEYGSLKYTIDSNLCIECGKCRSKCPQLTSKKQPVKKCFAGWAIGEEERETSTSGGIASVLYRQVLQKGGSIVGACYENGEFRLKLTQDENDIKRFKGSKYVNCNSQYIYKEVGRKINEGTQVLFVGTPCQVAAVKSFVGESDLLYTVDLVCHGTPPQSVFEEHFKAIDKKIVSVGFRSSDGPLYRLKMTDIKGNTFSVDAGVDEYYLSFLNGINFNDCCYECRYADKERVSDITIGDFWGIDKEIGKTENVKRISLVLCNSKQGEKLLNDSSELRLIERELSEALSENGQLVRPVHRSADRIKYEELYPKLGFDKTVHKLTIEKTRRKNKLLTTLSALKQKLKR